MSNFTAVWRSWWTALAVLVGIGATNSCSAATFYVWTNSTTDGPGTNWASAFHAIQDAIEAASSWDVVLVTNGVYQTGGVTNYPNGCRLMTRVAIPNFMTVRSVNGPSNTMIVGQGPMGDGAIRCAYLEPFSFLVGFTLTNGHTRVSGNDSERFGAGVWCTYGSLGVLSNCTLTANSAMGGGGAMQCTLNNCTLTANSAEGWGGGAVLSTLNNCTLTANLAGSGGGAEACTLNNCTVTANWAQNGAGSGVNGCILTNCILYFNPPDYNDDNYCYGSFNYCCTTPDPGGIGNITNDPQFVNAASGDYRLAWNSPCIDQGNNSAASGTTDVTGNPRVINGIVDIGAYEYCGPLIANDGVTNLGMKTATLGGSLLSTGNAPTSVYIYWGLTDGGTNETGWSNVTNQGVMAPGAFSANIMGLASKTLYYYRSFASNTAAVAWAPTSTNFLSYEYFGPSVDNDGGATNLVPNSATLRGTLLSTGSVSTSVRIYWGLTDGGTNETGWSNVTNQGVMAPGAFSATVAGLLTNFVYYYRCWASNDAATVWAAATTNFSSYWGGPRIDNDGGASGVTTGSAILNGYLISTGTAPSSVRVYWGTNDGGTNVSSGGWTNVVNVGVRPIGLFSTNLAQFAPATRYFYRCWASNSVGSIWAPSSTDFTTLGPRVDNDAGASGITSNSATLNGNLSLAGGGPTAVCIYWGPTDGGTNAGGWTNGVDMGVTAVGSFSNTISNLTSGFLYYYRCFASNAANVAWAPSTARFASAGTIHYVWLGSTNATWPYMGWNTAATNIQDAIDVSVDGDEVMVTNGLYKTGGHLVGTVNSRLAITKAIRVRSVNGPTNTIIQGRGPMGTQAERCVYLGRNATLTGFTLTGGYTRNYLSGLDDAIGQSGGGVYCEGPSAVVNNCILTGNGAWAHGGGACSGTLNDCLITGNSVYWQGGGASGGGAYFYVALNNCTVVGNSAVYAGGGVWVGAVKNSIVYSNFPSSIASFAYCCSPDAVGSGNIINGPGFVNYAMGDYRLVSNSPCINAGHNDNAVGESDLAGSSRIQAAVVDMGAYESSYAPIDATADPYGAINPSERVGVTVSGSQTFTITPDVRYAIVQDVLVDGVSIGATNAYTFLDVGSNHTIRALFSLVYPQTNGYAFSQVICTSNGLGLTWPATNGWFYTLQATPTLLPSVWTNVPGCSNMAGLGLMVITNDTSKASNMYFRLLAVPGN